MALPEPLTKPVAAGLVVCGATLVLGGLLGIWDGANAALDFAVSRFQSSPNRLAPYLP